MSPFILLLASLIPFLLAIGLLLTPLRGISIRLAPFAALPALLLSIFLPIGTTLDLPWLLFGSQFGINETTRIFLFFSSLLWLVAGIYSAGYFSNGAKKAEFFIWFLLAMAGNLGLILTQDMATFYTLFALMSFSSYGLVVHTRSVEALRAGRIYIILVVIGEVALFAAFALATQAAGNAEFVAARQAIAGAESRDIIIALLLLGFGIKAGFIGLHVWLPLAHPVAPTPASAVLSGAMISAGLLGWLKVMPLGEVALPFWGGVMMLAGMLSAFLAVLVGVLQNNPKTVLAYSSISSMGIMTMAVGLGLISPQNWPFILIAILIYALQHGLAKGALFLSVGMLVNPPATKAMRYLLMLAVLLPVLSLVGAPLTSGLIAKDLLKLQLLAVESPWADGVKTLMPLATLASSLLLARFIFLVWPRSASSDTSKAHNISPLMWVSWIALIVVVVISPWFISWFGFDIKTDATAANPLTQKIISLWPLLLATALALFIWRITLQKRAGLPFSIPAGDVLVFVEKWLWPALLSILLWAVMRVQKAREKIVRGTLGLIHHSDSSSIAENIEQRLRQWAMATLLLLLLVVFFVFMAAFKG